MRQLFGVLSSAVVLILISLYAWTHRSDFKAPVEKSLAAAQPVQNHVEYAEEAQARDMVTLSGPLAGYMTDQQSGSTDSTNAQPHGPRATVTYDYAGDSPVGTNTPLLHKTFSVATAANLPFQIPPHASSPTLHGTYSSFVQHAGLQSSDEADIEFMVLNQQQYSDLLSHHPNDALFSADGAHDHEVNFTLPPTYGQPVKYYLVFRNDSARGIGKVGVKADLRIEF